MAELLVGIAASLVAGVLLELARRLYLRLRRKRTADRGSRSEPGDATASAASPSLATRQRVPLLAEPVTTFVGRTAELETLRHLLAKARLVTILGPGGCGKSRLGWELARRLAAEYEGDVRPVDLAGISEPGLVSYSVAAALGVTDSPEGNVLTTLAEAARRRRVLLILDNCEHLVRACAEVATVLVTECQAVRILATSREPLKVVGESTYPLAPLPVPESTTVTVREALRSDAVVLFHQRAAAVRPGFEVTPSNVGAITAVCQRLDGLPLAIELAASRVRMMNPDDLARELEDLFGLLTERLPAARPRQETLLAIMDWSYGMLEPAAQEIFRSISILANRFSLTTAQQLCGDGAENGSPSFLDSFAGLVDASLVSVVPEVSGTTEYRLLETLRTYGRRLLGTLDEVDLAISRHTQVFLHVAESAEPDLTSERRGRVWPLLRTAHDDFRYVLGGYDNREVDPEVSVRIAGALFWFWNLGGWLSEGRRWSEAALSRTQDWGVTRGRAKALYGAGGLAFLQGDFEVARSRLESSVEMWRAFEARRELGFALVVLGMTKLHQNELLAARRDEEEAVSIFSELADRWGEALALNDLGNVLLAAGELEGSLGRLQASISLWRELGDPWGTSLTLGRLGCLTRRQGDVDTARLYLTQAYEVRSDAADRWGIAESLRDLGDLAVQEEDYKAAVDWYRDSLERNRVLGRQQMVADCLSGFADVASAIGQEERAQALSAGAEAIRQRIGQSLFSATGNERSSAGQPPGRTYTIDELIAETQLVRVR